MVAVVVPGHVPQLGPVAAGEGEEPLVEIDRRCARGRGERVVALLCESDRPAVADEGCEQGGDRQERQCAGERESCLPWRRHPALGEGQAGRDERGRSNQDQQVDRQVVPLARRGRKRRIRAGQRVLMRRHEHCERRSWRKYESGEEQLQPPRVDGDRDREPDPGGDPGAAAEREVDRREEHRQRRSGQRPSGDALRASCEPEREQCSQRGEDPERVPVRERFLDPVRGNRVEDTEPLWEEAREEAVPRGKEDGDERGREDEGDGRPPHQEDERREDRYVEQYSLPLEHRRCPVVAPEQREPGPSAEAGEPAE